MTSNRQPSLCPRAMTRRHLRGQQTWSAVPGTVPYEGGGRPRPRCAAAIGGRMESASAAHTVYERDRGRAAAPRSPARSLAVARLAAPGQPSPRYFRSLPARHAQQRQALRIPDSLATVATVAPGE
jgi:hypothetical protein